MKKTLIAFYCFLSAALLIPAVVYGAGFPIHIDDVHVEIWSQGDSTYNDIDNSPSIEIYSELLTQKGDWAKNGEWVLVQINFDTDNDGTIDAVTTYRYDTNGNLAKKETDNNTNSTIDAVANYLYNSAGDLDRIEHYTHDTFEVVVIFSYYDDGNLKSVEK